MMDSDELKEAIQDALHPELKYPEYPQHNIIFQSILSILNERWQEAFTLDLTVEQSEAIHGYVRRWNEDAGEPSALICQINGVHAPLTFHADGTATLTYP